MATEIASVYIGVHVDTSQIKSGMAKVRQAVDNTSKQAHTVLIKRLRAINNIIKPVVQISKAYSAAFIGFVGKALNSLYKMPTASGKAWKKTFDVFRARINVEMARIGKIFLKIPVFGKTMFQWMDKLVEVLKKLDADKIRKFTKAFEAAFIAIAASKAFMMISSVVKGLSGMRAIGAGGKAVKGVVASESTAASVSRLAKITMFNAILAPFMQLLTWLIGPRGLIPALAQATRHIKEFGKLLFDKAARTIPPSYQKRSGFYTGTNIFFPPMRKIMNKALFDDGIKILKSAGRKILLVALLLSVIIENFKKLMSIPKAIEEVRVMILNALIAAGKKMWDTFKNLTPEWMQNTVKLVVEFEKALFNFWKNLIYSISRIGLVLGALVSAQVTFMYNILKGPKEAMAAAVKEFDAYIAEGYGGDKLKSKEEVNAMMGIDETPSTALGFTGRYVGFSKAIENAQDIQKEYLNKMDELIAISKETRDSSKIFSDEVKKNK